MLAVTFALALTTSLVVSATPTTPVTLRTTELDWFYLYGQTDLKVVTPPKGKSFSADDSWLARAQYNASAYELGWDYLRVQANPEKAKDYSTRGDAYYHAGYLEGYLTARTIAYVTPSTAWGSCGGPAVQKWIAAHIAFMRNESATHKDVEFWVQVGALLKQVEGLTHGYNAATGHNVTFEDMFVMSFGPEAGDVAIAVSLTGQKTQAITHPWLRQLIHRREARLQMGSHCSALIRPTKDDLFMAHDTWSGFPGMAHRIFKRYDFQTTVTLSGYPAAIASGDDWYQTSHKLGVQETTNEVFNTSLYVAVVPQTVSEFVRVMTGNFIATSGKEWTAAFANHNSGTYNNQYMVVDFKKYSPGHEIKDDTLWIAEQVPGTVGLGDVSHVLRDQGYWASYNVPYFRHIYDISGYAIEEKAQGTFWSYSKYARPEIFRRNHTDVHDIATMMRMMRYNDYKNDPFSLIPNCTGATNNKCSPAHSSMLSIASRGDLMELFNTTAEMIAHYGPLYGFVAQGCFGAIDTKIASWKERESLAAWIINGPTNDQQPTFVWSKAAACVGQGPSQGSPDVLDFPWLRIES